ILLIITTKLKSTLFPYTTLFRSQKQENDFKLQISNIKFGDVTGLFREICILQFEFFQNPSIVFLIISTHSSNCSSVMISGGAKRSEEHTSELQSRFDLVCRLLLE